MPLVVVAPLLSSCGDDSPTQSQSPVASVTVAPDSADLFEGDTVRFVAVLRDAEGDVLSDRAIVWSSSSPDVASVDADGLVLGETSGSASIEASSEGVAGSGGVIVLQLPASITLSPDSFTVVPGETMRFNPTLLGERGDTLPDRLVSWSSGDTEVATVDADGLVTAVGMGSTTIIGSFDAFADSSRITVTTTTPFSLVSVWWSHACAVTTSGAAYCWGSNGYGQLGDGSRNHSETPVRVLGGLTFVSIAAGYVQTCGVTATGAAYCWGSNFYGALGTEQTTEMCGSRPCSTTPIPVEGGHAFRMVSSGEHHVCGVTTDNEAYCWGRNHDGQLGNDSTTQTCSANPCSDVPLRVVGGLDFESVSLIGIAHSCGLASGGQVYCWGHGPNNWDPAPEPGGLSFSSFNGGSFHNCGVTADFTGYCWGNGARGELGNGSLEESPLPIPVLGGLTFGSISAGGHHTCGVTTDGAAYCWGEAENGQLGSDWAPDCEDFGGDPCNWTPVPVMGELSFESVSAGYERTCGITKLGALYCWGRGDPTPVLITIP